MSEAEPPPGFVFGGRNHAEEGEKGRRGERGQGEFQVPGSKFQVPSYRRAKDDRAEVGNGEWTMDNVINVQWTMHSAQSPSMHSSQCTMHSRWLLGREGL